MECVERTKAVAKAMSEKKWELAVQLRGRSFARNLEIYKMLTRLKPPKNAFDDAGKGVVSTIFSQNSLKSNQYIFIQFLYNPECPSNTYRHTFF